MSIVSLRIADDNPITLEDMRKTADMMNMKIPEKDEKDYYTLLAALHSSVQDIMDLPDYVPTVDRERFPRENSHPPDPKTNTLGAWAHHVTVHGAKEGPLKGHKVCLKDNICLADIPLANGTDCFTGYVPNIDATVVTRILEAGGTIVGKATCENLCHSATSFSAATGPVHNPYGIGFSSGGSSSGCGALVASGECSMAIGADQGGSIRVPSAYCGLVGLKPTHGLVPYTGIVTSEATIDHAGPMTRTVLENALLLSAIAGVDGIDDRQVAGTPFPGQVPEYHKLVKDSAGEGVKGMKIGVLKEGFEMNGVDERVAVKIKSAIERFKELGAEVEEVSIPFHKVGPTLWVAISRQSGTMNRIGRACGRRTLFMNDYNAVIGKWTPEMYAKAFPSTINSNLNGAFCWENYPGLYGKAVNLSRRLRDEYDAALSKYDVLVLPTTPVVANRHGDKTGTPLQILGKAVGNTLNTTQFDSTGHPALTMPIGTLPPAEADILEPEDRNIKLPVAMQIVGKHFDEAKVYKVAYAWEQAAGNWKDL